MASLENVWRMQSEPNPIMELVGVSDIVSDYRIQTAVVRGISVYASLPDKQNDMQDAGVPVAGTIDDLLSKIDVVVDCTPKGIGAKNLDRYREAGVKAIVQGGEKHSLTGHSFVAQANYASALGRDTTRVVSCNTTSTVRTLTALRDAGLLKKARGVLIRRATDPWEADHSGIMNTVVPEDSIPSHQGPDAQTVVPELDVITIAAKAAHTQNHSHFWIVELTKEASRDEVLAAFRAAPRIAFIRMREGVVALNSAIELMKDLERPRGDMWEVGLWEDVLQGFQEAIQSVFPQVTLQRCVIHQIRNSLKYIVWKERKAFAHDLKAIYQAPTREAAETALLTLAETWGEKYAIAVRSWENNWDNLATMFDYTPEIRRLIYTTNLIEGYNRQLRKVTQNRGAFPSPEAARKSLWLAHRDIVQKWTMPIPNWAIILNQLAIRFEDRFPI